MKKALRWERDEQILEKKRQLVCQRGYFSEGRAGALKNSERGRDLS